VSRPSGGGPSDWLLRSPDGPGFFTVVSPASGQCRVTSLFRINLPAGAAHTLRHADLELSAVVISGVLELAVAGGAHHLSRLDSFYLPAGMAAEVRALSDLVLYLGGGPYEGEGRFFVRRFDLGLPLGAVHQVHGTPPYRRTVFQTLDQDTPASRLITGITIGDPGGWTSWPPHQHQTDLEEAYFYFDIPRPQFALHLSYREPGRLEAVHPVSSGDAVLVPRGYHPTVAMPGVRSSYFWVMVAFSRQSRRYDLAVPDPLLTPPSS
jgi:5-deoxy-glucuronate isomerase